MTPARRDSQWVAAKAETEMAMAQRKELQLRSLSCMCLQRFVRYAGAVKTAEQRGATRQQAVEQALPLLRKHAIFAFG